MDKDTPATPNQEAPFFELHYEGEYEGGRRKASLHLKIPVSGLDWPRLLAMMWLVSPSVTSGSLLAETLANLTQLGANESLRTECDCDH